MTSEIAYYLCIDFIIVGTIHEAEELKPLNAGPKTKE